MALLPVSKTYVPSSYFSKVCTQFQEKKNIHILHPGTLGTTFISSSVDEVCTQFEEKPAVHSRPYEKLVKGFLLLLSSITEFDEVCTQF